MVIKEIIKKMDNLEAHFLNASLFLGLDQPLKRMLKNKKMRRRKKQWVVCLF